MRGRQGRGLFLDLVLELIIIDGVLWYEGPKDSELGFVGRCRRLGWYLHVKLLVCCHRDLRLGQKQKQQK